MLLDEYAIKQAYAGTGCKQTYVSGKGFVTTCKGQQVPAKKASGPFPVTANLKSRFPPGSGDRTVHPKNKRGGDVDADCDSWGWFKSLCVLGKSATKGAGDFGYNVQKGVAERTDATGVGAGNFLTDAFKGLGEHGKFILPILAIGGVLVLIMLVKKR